MDNVKTALSIDDIDILTAISDSPKASVHLASVKGSAKLVVYKELKSKSIASLYRKIEELKSIFFPEVYGVWEENGNTFLIEEYIPGETLAEKVEQGCLFSEEELSRYMLQLCEALLVLHRAEPPIIHRDLKPDNILVTEAGSLKLLDFDAAREYDEAQSRDTVILGTKEYASPEQFGFTQTDVRSDIYSFGIVFSELLKNTNATVSYAKKCQKIIDKATMFDPDKRYPDAEALYKDLCAINKGIRYKSFILLAVLLCLICISGLIGLAVNRNKSSVNETTPQEQTSKQELPAPSESKTQEKQSVATEQITTDELTPTTTPKETTVVPKDGIAIDEANFPDPYFRQYVRDTFDFQYGTEGYLSPLEISNAKGIYVSDTKIKDLTGIEHFSKLNSLNCNKTAISKLDISNNPELTQLHCSVTAITELDVSNNPKLHTLECCHLSLYQIDVSNNTELVNLYISDTLIEELDVSNNVKLSKLDCQKTNLKRLDISNNTNLTKLECGRTELESLDINNNSMLEYLDVYQTKITEINVSNNTYLNTLSCGENKIASLDVSNNKYLTFLHCGDTEIAKLDLSSNSRLSRLDCYNTKITELDLSNNLGLATLHCAGLKIKELNLSNNSRLVDLDCADIKTLDKLDLRNNLFITRLICSGTIIPCLELSTKMSRLTEVEFISTELNIIRIDMGEFGCCYKLNNLYGFDIDKVSHWIGASCKDEKLIGFEAGETEAECLYNLDKDRDISFIFYGTSTGEHAYIDGVCSECGAK